MMMSSHRRLGAGGWVSLLWSLLVFISVCRGAAVDAPSQTLTVTSEPSIIELSTTVSPSLMEDSGLEEEGSGETEGDHPRFARSVPGHDSVFDYYDYSAHKSSHLSRNSGPSSRAGQLPVNSLSEPRDPLSRAPTWQLEPQVGKSARGKRVRSGGQSSRYRSREQEPEELLAIENSLDAVERGAATTMLSRQQRNGRRYDVPQIGKSYLRSHKTKSNKVSLCQFVIPWVEFDRIDRVHSLKQAFVKNNILVQVHTGFHESMRRNIFKSLDHLMRSGTVWSIHLIKIHWIKSRTKTALSNVFGISWLWLRRWFSALTANVRPAWAALGQPGHFPWLSYREIA